MAENGRCSTKLEFAVQMTCGSCSSAVRNALQGAPGVQSVEIDLQREEVLVDTTLTSQEVQDLIEKTGRRAVLKGVGSAAQKDLGAAVAMLSGSNLVQGVVRFLQVSEDRCLIEGTVDGLEPGPHGLHVHEFGDLTDDCLSCGGHFNPFGKPHGAPQESDRHVGDLGNILAGPEGRAVFRLEDQQLKAGLWDHRSRRWTLPEPQTDLQLRRGHPLGGERPPPGRPRTQSTQSARGTPLKLPCPFRTLADLL
ncbi:copper chaperone for superoxide dismutase-like [Acipenser ruthenus]|uniref:copper chaperone for superoxide dismutase-like n=1 Tax=Acipenser ruthenus TaxID=7906 RepID=UPI002740E2D0|nr:copper chaperone for superoxide dismutase-like [Acipenser ruthenus]